MPLLKNISCHFIRWWPRVTSPSDVPIAPFQVRTARADGTTVPKPNAACICNHMIESKPMHKQKAPSLVIRGFGLVWISQDLCQYLLYFICCFLEFNGRVNIQATAVDKFFGDFRVGSL